MIFITSVIDHSGLPAKDSALIVSSAAVSRDPHVHNSYDESALHLQTAWHPQCEGLKDCFD